MWMSDCREAADGEQMVDLKLQLKENKTFAETGVIG